MAKVIAVTIQKGGVGKTATSAALGAGFTRKGYSTLFVDLDAQGNLSYTLEADATGLTGKSAFEILQKQCTALEAIQHTGKGNIIASSPALAGLDTVLTSIGKEYRLREALKPLQELYDYIVIDTPPALGIATINALTAAGGVIIPSQADVYSLQGIAQLNNTIQTVKEYCNPSLKVLGIAITRYNGRAVISRDMAELLKQAATQMQSKVFQCPIRECSAIREAAARRADIYTYAPRSNAAADYSALVDEIITEDK
jgi:chromosome partitioning protein